MAPAPESRKEQRTALVEILRRDGLTWEQVANELRRHETASPLLALRWAHNLNQQQVADAYNALLTPDPDDKPIDFRRVCRWELWPVGGAQPPLPALNRLAQVFQVRASFLFDGADYRTLDPNHQPQPTTNPTHHDLPPTNPLPPTAPAGLRRGKDRTPVPTTLRPDQLAPFDPRSPGRGMAGLTGEPQLLLLTGRTYMERRTVLEVIASIPGVTLLTGTTSLLNPEATDLLAHTIKRPDKVGPKALAPLGDLIMGYRRLDDILGARHVTEPVTTFLNLVKTILPAAEPNVRKPLFSLAASAAQLAGFLAVEASDHERARNLFDQAIEWATAADDTALVAYLWCCRSSQARARLDPLGAIGAAEAARRIAVRENVILHAWVEKTASRAYALAGDLDETIRAMDTATELLTSADPAEAPSWLYHFHPEILIAERGSALVDAGQGTQAVELLTDVIDRLPASFVRHRGIYMASQATALWVAGDLRNACTVGTEAVLIGRRTGSARAIEKIGRLHRSFDAKAAQLPEARELGDLLRENPPA